MTLLERDGELSVLDDVLSGAQRGRGRVAVVGGPPGIGKTALLAAARARAGGRMRALTAVGGELDRELPFGVVRQLLEPVVRTLDTSAGSGLFGGAAGLSAPVFARPEAARLALGDVVHGLYWLCVNLADAGPLLLVVDDLHWSDEASLRFLSHLARRMDGLSISLVAAARSGAALDALCARTFGGVDLVSLRPAPLTADSVRTLVRRELGDDADDAFCTACSGASGGNPFLLTETLASLKHDQVRPLAQEADRVARLRPEAISRAVLTRIGRIGPAAIAFTRALAVLGPTVAWEQLCDFSSLGTDTALACADALTYEEICSATQPLDFVHPLVREAVYGDMSSTRREAEHKRAAHLLADAGAPHEQVAAHLLLTRPGSEPWVATSLRAAAASATARGAPESAIAALLRAGEETAPPGESRPPDVELARALGMAGRITEAAAVYREAIERAEGPIAQLMVALELVLVLGRAGRGRESVSAVARARACVDLDDPENPPELRAMLVGAGLVAMEPPSFWMPRLERIAQEVDADTELGRTIRALRAFGATATGSRSASDTAQLASLAAQGPVPSNDGGVLVAMAGAALGGSGHLTEALDLLTRGIEDAGARGNRAEFCYLSVIRSQAALYAGHVAEAESDARGALASLEGEDHTPNIPLAAAVLIDTLVQRGAVAEAGELLGTYALTGELPDEALIEYLVPMARGALRLAEQRPSEALADYLVCGSTLTAHGYVNPAFAQWRAGAVAAYAELGQLSRAITLAQENLDLAREFDAPHSTALALRMAARVAEPEMCLEHLAEAATLLADAGPTLEHPHVLVRYGTALARAGHRENALTVLRRGLELAARCGAAPLVSAADRELRLLGLRPRRTAVTGREALTASELRVASLAADGPTNRQIAQALFVTTRTVEVHLTNAYRKLSIENRQQLAEALGREL